MEKQPFNNKTRTRLSTPGESTRLSTPDETSSRNSHVDDKTVQQPRSNTQLRDVEATPSQEGATGLLIGLLIAGLTGIGVVVYSLWEQPTEPTPAAVPNPSVPTETKVIEKQVPAPKPETQIIEKVVPQVRTETQVIEKAVPQIQTETRVIEKTVDRAQEAPAAASSEAKPPLSAPVSPSVPSSQASPSSESKPAGTAPSATSSSEPDSRTEQPISDPKPPTQ